MFDYKCKDPKCGGCLWSEPGGWFCDICGKHYDGLMEVTKMPDLRDDKDGMTVNIQCPNCTEFVEVDAWVDHLRCCPGVGIINDSPVPERHGHPDFYKLLEGLAALHSEKNHDYASGGDPLGNFMRRANLYGMYPGLDLSNRTVVAIVDAMKQLDAALWFLSNGHEAKVEGIESRLRDVAVYSLLAIILNRKES